MIALEFDGSRASLRAVAAPFPIKTPFMKIPASIPAEFRAAALAILLGLLGPLAGAADALSPEPKRKAEDFVGEWNGKWDGVWPVMFTVSIDKATNELHIIYAWQEKVGGEWSRDEYFSSVVNNVLRVGQTMTISLSATDPKRAVAKGRFRPTPREAELERK